MQNSPLPIQVSGASAPNAPQRQNSNGDTGEFSAALAREIEQRKESAPAAPAPPPARAQAAKQPQAQDKPASTAKPAEEPDTPAAQAADQPADATTLPEEANDTQASSQPDQVADILALMASFNQALQKAGAAAPAGDGGDDVPAFAAGHAQPEAVQFAAVQFAALQAATRRPGQDSGTAAQGAVAAAGAGQERAALPEALAGAQAKGAAPQAADLHAAAAPGQPRPQAEFSAQLARETAAQAEAFKIAATPAPTSAPLVQVQQALANPALAAAAGDHLPARVGTQAWNNQVGQKVVWMVAGGDQSAELTLNPPDLGPLQVILSVNGDQASVQFSANQQEVRQALENALPRLREMMSESGIALGSATVGTGTPDQRQAQGDEARGGRGGFDNGPAEAEAAQRTARTTVLGERGMVDTFA